MFPEAFAAGKAWGGGGGGWQVKTKKAIVVHLLPPREFDKIDPWERGWQGRQIGGQAFQTNTSIS